ncbi:hypothetical protein [Sulfurospirillum cavolei]|uniref:hypothetical protein n=1 Tax=Sulfurospirillum cavolei TaxID=366522 RepID=UPI003FA2310A
MDFYKDERIAEEIKTAIQDFGKKNNLNGMGYFSEKLGFKGANRSVQLHNHISHKNIEKDLKLSVLFAVLEEMDSEEHATVLRAFCEKYGFGLAKEASEKRKIDKTIEATVTLSILTLGSTLGGMDEDVMQAIEDGKIDKSEAKRILKSIAEVEKTTRGLRDALIEHIG